MTYDVVTLGEAMLRLWVPPGESLEDAPSLRVSVAGAEANVAAAGARMGLATAWISRLPASPLGRRAAGALRALGVDVSYVTWDPTRRMGTYYVELSAPPRPIHVIYDRASSAASAMTVDHVPWDVVTSSRSLHLSGITPALSPTCREVSTRAVTMAREAGVLVSIDVNYRARLWDVAEAAAVVGELCRDADLVIVTAEDARDLWGVDGDVDTVLARLRERLEARRVVLTMGGDGAAWIDGETSGAAPGLTTSAIDRIGAGDAFAAGVLVGVLGDDLSSGVAKGTAMAALTMGTYGDHFLGDPGEVDQLLSGHPRQVDR